ncbi:hypothetical protein MAPG_08866 [Magnaporthiopsis poae ATCC 64411]|uniref:Zn(2)-C6 fungal-type domain-containing protein n=1 Tax=Magnaporthiopsis poae (strain ATCC 64411 / 73-15) TaxID=644358 RepID=A0A0C4E8G5_MAGP6|nr:hypothetical protein MAPG_08866 [Magnaporthiopsis poae ATCC 64411]
MSDGHSDDMPARKRIAVACGRCRKRKIRCSGDPGGGMPCTNCKTANADGCQFLRVSSNTPGALPATGFFAAHVNAPRWRGRSASRVRLQHRGLACFSHAWLHAAAAGALRRRDGTPRPHDAGLPAARIDNDGGDQQQLLRQQRQQQQCRPVHARLVGVSLQLRLEYDGAFVGRL